MSDRVLIFRMTYVSYTSCGNNNKEWGREATEISSLRSFRKISATDLNQLRLCSNMVVGLHTCAWNCGGWWGRLIRNFLSLTSSSRLIAMSPFIPIGVIYQYFMFINICLVCIPLNLTPEMLLYTTPGWFSFALRPLSSYKGRVEW